jgi:toxin ParE1/3/4
MPAGNQLREIFDYIAAGNPRRQPAQFGEFAGDPPTARMPNAGRIGRVAGTREITVPGTPYLVAYRVLEDMIPGARDSARGAGVARILLATELRNEPAVEYLSNSRILAPNILFLFEGGSMEPEIQPPRAEVLPAETGAAEARGAASPEPTPRFPGDSRRALDVHGQPGAARRLVGADLFILFGCS